MALLEVTTITDLESSLATGGNVSCKMEPSKFLFVRYCFIGIFGFAISVIGVFMNITLLIVLTKSFLRNTYFVYLSALAVLDIAVAITYIMVMSIAVLFEYLESMFLYQIWYTCLPYFFTLSRIVTLASTYMVVVCTAERFLEVAHLAQHCDQAYKVRQTTRYTVIAMVIILSAAFRVVVFWELRFNINEDCKGTLIYYDLDQTWLVKDFYYSKVYAFWILHMVQVFFPFGALILVNVMIVRNWRFALRKASSYTAEEILRRVRSAQSARKMMAAIVASYLVCNLLNLFVTFMEHIDFSFLHKHKVFYSFSSDVVTMLTVVNASFRLPIYYACNFKIRAEIRRIYGRTMIKPMRAVYRKISKNPRAIMEVRSPNAASTSEGGMEHEKLDETTLLQASGGGITKKLPDVRTA